MTWDLKTVSLVYITVHYRLDFLYFSGQQGRFFLQNSEQLERLSVIFLQHEISSERQNVGHQQKSRFNMQLVDSEARY